MLFEIAERIGDKGAYGIDERILYCWWVEVAEEVLVVSEKKAGGWNGAVINWRATTGFPC